VQQADQEIDLSPVSQLLTHAPNKLLVK